MEPAQPTATTNPLLCDIESGACEMPGAPATQAPAPVAPRQKPIRVIYYTDPICSSCWGIEPQLRRLKLEYGATLDIEYRMGGLLPDWSYNSGGISKPADVAHHWDEASRYYDMPIDGNVWLTDPLPSSYPPSIAFKAAQLQDPQRAVTFLRVLREMVFLQQQNIARWEPIAAAARRAGLDAQQLQADCEGPAKARFAADLELGRQLGVRGFPTLFFVGDNGQQEIVYGSKPYQAYAQAVTRLQPAAPKHAIDPTWQALFAHYPSLTAREFAELSGTPRPQSEAALDALVTAGHLTKLTTRNGALWTRK